MRFAKDLRYLTLRLKRSKTDTRYKGVNILVAATSNAACPIAAMQALFNIDPQPPNTLLFRLSNGPFSRSAALRILSKRLKLAGVRNQGFTGYSFRKGAL